VEKLSKNKRGEVIGGLENFLKVGGGPVLMKKNKYDLL
jgi:hypothetical protein